MIEVIEYLTRIYPWILLGVAVAAAVAYLVAVVISHQRRVRGMRRMIEERYCLVCRRIWDDDSAECHRCAICVNKPCFEAEEKYKRIAEGWRYKRGKKRKNH